MKKQIALAMAAFTLLGALGGCQPAGKAGGEDVDFSKAPSGEITVGSYDYMSYGRHMEAAAKRFMAKYPGTTVNVTTFSSMPEIKMTSSEDGSMAMAAISMDDNAGAEADYLQALNTELMGGGGADVLAMDVLPYYKYADAGQLLDMSSFMADDPGFDRRDYYETVLDAMQYNDGQYILPLDFTFNYLTYSPELLSAAQQEALAGKKLLTYDDLLAIGAMDFTPQEDLSVLTDSKTGFFHNMFRANLSRFIDLSKKTCDFTSGAFEALLTDTVNRDAAGYLVPEPESFDFDSNGTFVTGGAISAMLLGGGGRSYFASNMNLMLMNHFNTNEDGEQMFLTPGGANTDEHEIAGLLANNEGKAEVDYMKAFGINANTKNARLAWEFIKFLLTEDEQLSIQVVGTPVHRAAAEEDVKQEITRQIRMSGGATSIRMPDSGGFVMSGSVDAGSDGGNGGENALTPGFSISGGPINMEEAEEPPLVRAVLNEKQTEVYNRYMSQLTAFLADLQTHTVEDSALSDIVHVEADRFFAGEISAAEAAQAIQNKISLILSEQ